jgi:hypothetical protein
MENSEIPVPDIGTLVFHGWSLTTPKSSSILQIKTG